ncbi:MAG: hypothetical protein ABIJ34_06610, partial [archaeon]
TTWTARAIGFAGAIYNISAWQPWDLGENATANITVLRQAVIDTDKNYYVQRELLNISGRSYSPSSIVTLWVKNKDTGGTVLGFPKSVYTDATGKLNISWNISDYCAGNFEVIGTDDSYPTLLNSSKNFTLRGWWNSSWTKRKPLVVSNTGTAQSNIPIRANITGLNISNCYELRVVSTLSGEPVIINTLSGNNRSWCDLEFLGNASANTNESNYYVYYNNSQAANPNYPMINATLETVFFDNFNSGIEPDTAKWTETGGQWNIEGQRAHADTCAVPGDYITTIANDSSQYKYANVTFSWEVASGYMEGDDCLAYHVYNGASWTTKFSKCDDSSPTSGSSNIYLGESNMISGFQMRFWCDTDDANEQVWVDNVQMVGRLKGTRGISVVSGTPQEKPAACIVVDGTKPSVSIVSPVNYFNTTDSTPEINFTMSDNLDTLLNYTIYADGIFAGLNGTISNNTYKVLNFSVLGEGQHTITVVATDDFLNAKNVSIIITVDYSGPNATISTPLNFTNITTGTRTVRGTLLDSYLPPDTWTVEYRTNETAVWQFVCSDPSYSYQCEWDLAGLYDGNSYQLRGYGNDTLGNIGDYYYITNITIDRNGPQVNITNLVNYSNYSVTQLILTMSAFEAIKEIDVLNIEFFNITNQQWSPACKDTNGIPYTCTWRFNYEPEYNNYRLRAFGNDTLGNIGPYYYVNNITIDRTGPNITHVNASPNSQYLGFNVNISANITDLYSQVSYAEARITLPNASLINITLSKYNGLYNATFLYTASVGLYNITIFANDSLGNSNTFSYGNFTIGYGALSLSTDLSNYVIGNDVQIQGTGFSANKNVTIRIYNSSYDEQTSYDVISNVTGGIGTGWVIPAGSGLGTYFVNATDLNDNSRSISTTFEVVSAIIQTLDSSYEQGGIVNITGSNWGLYENVTINITDQAGYRVYGPVNISANGSGYLNSYWRSGYNSTPGEYTITAYQPSDSNKFDTYVFNITKRPVTLLLDFTWYKEGEDINLTGYGFSPNENITIAIYDPIGNPVLGYPLNITSNSTGGINHTYTVSGLGEGTYTINVTDSKYKNLKNSTGFEIVTAQISPDSATYNSGETITLTGLYWDRGAIVTINITNSTGFNISGYPINIAANSTGGFIRTLTAIASQVGENSYNVSAYEPYDAGEHANATYVVLRVVTLQTDKVEYDQNESVNITGSFYTISGDVLINLSRITGGTAINYPKLISADTNGDIENIWNSGDYCEGEYLIETTDQTYTILFANYTFNITFLELNSSVQLADQDNVTVTAGPQPVISGSYLNTQADDDSFIYVSSEDPNSEVRQYIELDYDLSGLGITANRYTNINIFLDYCYSGGLLDCAGGDDPDEVSYYDQYAEAYNFTSGTWRQLGLISVGSSNTQQTQDWNITSGFGDLINSSDFIKLRFEHHANSIGASNDTVFLIDYARLNVSYKYHVDRTCSQFDTTPPSVRNLSFDPSSQDLGKAVDITVNVTDDTDVDKVIAVVTDPNGLLYNISLTDSDTDSVFNGVFLATSSVGTYNVTIYANDTWKNINSSIKGNFTVNYYTLEVYTDKQSYVLGDYVNIRGNGFTPNKNVSIRIYNSSDINMSGYPKNIFANSSGGINDTWFIPGNVNLGSYAINVTDLTDASRSANATFSVVSAVIESAYATYAQGKWINFTGYNWDNNIDVTINITDPAGRELFGPMNITSNSSGYINMSWFADYNLTEGSHEIRAYEPSNNAKYDSFDFTVTKRSVSISTDFSWYKEGETINFTGSGFSPNSNISLALYNSTGVVEGYPINITSNATGHINFSIIVNHPLGDYFANLTDTRYPNLHNMTNFSIVSQSVTTDKDNYVIGGQVVISGNYWDRNTIVTLNLTNSTGRNASYFPINVTSSADGAISHTWTAELSSQGTAIFNLTAYDKNGNYASKNFSVQRVATVTLQAYEFDQDEVINITGKYFTSNNDVKLLIRSSDNETFVYFYPKKVATDTQGSMQHLFNTSNICQREYTVEVTDIISPTLFSQISFNATYLENNASVAVPNSSQGEGSFNIFGATYVNTTKSDDNWQYIGMKNLQANFEAYLNFSFNISGFNVIPSRLKNLSFSVEYCHSGNENENILKCGAEFKHEGTTTGTQDIEIFNFSNSRWYNFSNLPVDDDSDQERDFNFSIDNSLYDFVHDNIIHLRFEMNFTQIDSNDDLLLIDYLQLNLSYRTPVNKSCIDYDSNLLEINNLDDQSRALQDTSFMVINWSNNEIIDSDNSSYQRYLPKGNLSILVISDTGAYNLSYKVYNLNFSSVLNITSQIVMNYSYGLPSDVRNITPIIAVNDSALVYEKTELTIPKRNVSVNSILHCKNYSYVTAQCFEFVVNDTDIYEYYETDDQISFNVTSFDAFGGGGASTIPNVTKIRIYNVTGNIDTHRGGTLIFSALDATFNLTPGNIYRVDFEVYVAGKKWDMVGSDYALQSGLNETWYINASRDIWYNSSYTPDTNYTGGNFVGGVVEWNLSQGGRINTGAAGNFMYVVNISTNIGETYPVYFVINDTSTSSGSFDYSAYKILDVSQKSIQLHEPIDEDNITTGLIAFNWTLTGGLEQNLTCTLKINDLDNFSIETGSYNSTTVSVDIATSEIYNWSVRCIDNSEGITNSNTTYFYLISRPHVSINLLSDNTSIRLNWSEVSIADSYNVYITDNYTAGFFETANFTGITDTNWIDVTAGSDARRFYMVSAVKGNANARSNTSVGKLTKNLVSGWNLVSLPFNISDWKLYDGVSGTDLITDPGGCLVALWRYNASNQSFQSTYYSGAWNPSIGDESFTRLEAGRSYWLETSTSCNLTTFGAVPYHNQTVPLKTYWNMVAPFSGKDQLLYDEATSKLIDVIPEESNSVILRYNEQTELFEVTVFYSGWGFWPSYNNQDFVYLNPGRGYYFDQLTDANWTYDPKKS